MLLELHHFTTQRRDVTSFLALNSSPCDLWLDHATSHVHTSGCMYNQCALCGLLIYIHSLHANQHPQKPYLCCALADTSTNSCSLVFTGEFCQIVLNTWYSCLSQDSNMIPYKCSCMCIACIWLWSGKALSKQITPNPLSAAVCL